MAPEYGSWNQVDKKLQGQVKESLGELDLDLAKCVNQEGLAFLVQEEQVVRVCGLEELSEGQLEDSRKMSSPWHVVKPLEGTKKGHSSRKRESGRRKRLSRRRTGTGQNNKIHGWEDDRMDRA